MIVLGIETVLFGHLRIIREKRIIVHSLYKMALHDYVNVVLKEHVIVYSFYVIRLYRYHDSYCG